MTTTWTSPDGTATLYTADVLAGLRALPERSVQCVVTSPPYWGLRDYGTAEWEGGDAGCDHSPEERGSRFATPVSGKQARNAGSGTASSRDCPCGARRIDQQLGLEPTPDAYVASMVAVFREVRRVLRNDGTLWLNLGDSYASQGGAHGGRDDNQTGVGAKRTHEAGAGDKDARRPSPGLKPKDLCCIPWRVAMALQQDGWYLRSAMPWVKRNPMPESVTDRPASALEYMFLLSKRGRYFFDAEAVKVDGAGYGRGTGPGAFRSAKYTNNQSFDNDAEIASNGTHGHSFEGGRNYRNADLFYQSIEPPHGLIFCGDEPVGLDVNPAAYKQAHFATFSPKLVEPCVKSGTSERGCCPACGAPWARVVEKPNMPQVAPSDCDRFGTGESGVHRKVGQAYQNWRDENPNRTTGWTPTCECPAAEPVPCTVMDLFSGSATTGAVALRLGRRYIGIELSAEYQQLAITRIEATLDDQALFRQADPDDAPGLFEEQP